MTPTATATPTLTPALVITPTNGGANTPVTVTGANFSATAPFSLYLGLTATEPYTTGLTDASGGITLTFPMPAAWPAGQPIPPGPLAVTAVSNGGRLRASTTFTYTVP